MGRSTASPAAVPIFPLEQVVLFPGAQVPLYIFEPRYRAMTRDALAGDKRIGMVTVLPEAVDQVLGQPQVFDIGCEGVIEAWEERDDGTYNIVLLGSSRFRIREELALSEEPSYRSALIQHLKDPFEAKDWVPAQTLYRDVLQVIAKAQRRELGEDALQAPSPEALPAALSTLCQYLNLGPAEKQQLLEANGVLDRLGKLSELVHFQLAAQAAQRPSKSRLIH